MHVEASKGRSGASSGGAQRAGEGRGAKLDETKASLFARAAREVSHLRKPTELAVMSARDAGQKRWG